MASKDSCLAYSSALNVEEMSDDFQRTIRDYILEHRTLYYSSYSGAIYVIICPVSSPSPSPHPFYDPVYVPCVKFHVHFSLLRTFRKFPPSLWPFVTFRNKFPIYSEEFLGPHPIPDRDCFLQLSTLESSFSICKLRTLHLKLWGSIVLQFLSSLSH